MLRFFRRWIFLGQLVPSLALKGTQFSHPPLRSGQIVPIHHLRTVVLRLFSAPVHCPLSSVRYDCFRMFANAVLELRRSKHFGMAAPAEDPALDFKQVGQFDAELDASIAEGFDLLCGVPVFFLNQLRGPVVELDADLMLGVTAEYAEGVF